MDQNEPVEPIVPAPKERILWMDALGAVAMFGVVLIHTNLRALDADSSFAWHLLLAGCGYWAVPAFFMLTGARLMGYRERYGTKEFFAKRFKKTMIPWVSWSLLIFLVYAAIGTFGTFKPLPLAMYFLWSSFGCWLQPNYWFFIPLFGVYLCIPLLSRLKERRLLLWCIAGALLAFGMVLRLLPLPFPKSDDLRFPLSGYLGYAILGYLLSTGQTKRAVRAAIYCLSLCGAVLIYGYILRDTLRSGELDMGLLNYQNPPVALLGVSGFLLFRQIRWERLFRGQRSVSALSQVSACGMGTYLIHWFPLLLAYTAVPNSIDAQWCLLTALLVYAVSVPLVWGMRKVPVLRALVP